MKPHICCSVIALGCLLGVGPSFSAAASDPAPRPAEEAAAFRTEMGRLADEAASQGLLTVAGTGGWLFQANELRFLSLERFWGERAAQVSRASNPDYADPIPAIVRFHHDLAARGIDLLLVPVPAKAAVYPDRITAIAPPLSGARLDAAVMNFYDVLRDQGVNVLDLTPTFLAARDPEQDPLYCRTDTHWSPRGCRLAAREAAEWLKQRPWYQPTNRSYPITAASRTLYGDLLDGAPDPKPAPDNLTFYRVGDAPISSDDDSPVILMGDSHTLVFQDGRLHGAQAGFADHLAASLGGPLDLQFRNKGSGSTHVRIELFRRQMKARKAGADYLGRKHAVVWCFTSREFSESTSGWRPLPLEK